MSQSRWPAPLNDLLKWLHPGLRVKRWMAGFALGVGITSVGLAYAFIRLVAPPGSHFYEYLPGGLPFAAVMAGVLLAGVSMVGLYRAIVNPLKPHNGDTTVSYLYRYRMRQRGPKVVAIGGGTGLSTLLRGLKDHSDNLTAIVTVADDGGSSGRLRRELGVLPPGDFRNCIVALAETEPTMARLFQYRFGPGSVLEGHSFGNLFITAMSGVTGTFPEALKETSRVLAVRGQVLPSTLESVALLAHLHNGHTIHGESHIPNGGSPIRRVELQPTSPQAYPEAVQAILDADLVVIGPGSLYTSVLPNLLVPGIAQALRESAALKVYVCNVATQPGETDGYNAPDHVRAIHYHVGPGLFDYVLVNNNLGPLPADHSLVCQDGAPPTGVTEIAADLVPEGSRLRHDPAKLASCLMGIYEGGRERQPAARR